MTYLRARKPPANLGFADRAPDGLAPAETVREKAGVVELSLLLPATWFDHLLDEAEATGVTVGRLLRRLVADHLAESPFSPAVPAGAESWSGRVMPGRLGP